MAVQTTGSFSAPPLAVSMGDPAGIGLDISLAAWTRRRELGLPAFVLIADPRVLADRAAALSLHVPLVEIAAPADASTAFGEALPVIPIEAAVAVVPGKPDSRAAAAIVAAIEMAVAAAVRGEAIGVVTNPIAKRVLYEAGFRHPGHTEFLAELASRHCGGGRFVPIMMIASDLLRVVPATIHVPLAEVPSAITRGLIFDTVRLTHDALTRDFGIEHPRIAVCGLNPHAGEDGSIGREDVEVIAPAIAELRSEGLAVSGPHSADTMFHEAARKTYDAAICMYHDQALIPAKTLAFDQGVNVTLGLPFVRTSPDHGTAFSLAGTGRASAESFIAACRMAYDMGLRRRASGARPADSPGGRPRP